jgi:flagellar protein FliO/FliZ
MAGPGAVVATSAAHGLLVASQTTTAPDISIGHVLLQMVVALLVVVGGIWGFSKIMRRGGRFGGTPGRARHKTPVAGLTVLSRQSIGKGKSIAVVQAGSRRFLVGISESGLNPIGEIGPNDEAASVAGDLGPMAVPTANRPAAAISTAAIPTANGWSAAIPPANGMAGERLPTNGVAASAASWLDGLREATVRR